MANKATKKLVGWAGIVDGKVDMTTEADSDSRPLYAIYKTKKLAKEFYEEVRKVEIREE